MSRQNAEKAAQVMSDLVNNLNLDSEEFVNTIMKQHRTIQQDLFRLFVDTMKRWEEMGKIGMYDARNEHAVGASQVMLEAMRKEYGGDFVGRI